MADGPIAPKVRTARRQHECDEYTCLEPILPGEQYQLLVVPPHRMPEYDVDRWLTHRSHHPQFGPNGEFLFGCDLAAAYAEQARREAAVHAS